MSAAYRGARYGLETPGSYGRIFPQRAVPTAKVLRAIRGRRRRFPARRTHGGAWGWLLRSDERGVGQGRVRTCSARWSPSPANQIEGKHHSSAKKSAIKVT